jgi:hypothetical protein
MPTQCEQCGKQPVLLTEVGIKNRRWLCDDCILRLEEKVLSSDEFYKVKVNQRRGNDVANAAARRAHIAEDILAKELTKEEAAKQKGEQKEHRRDHVTLEYEQSEKKS